MEQVKKAKKVRKVRKVKKKKIANLATQGSHERVDEDGIRKHVVAYSTVDSVVLLQLKNGGVAKAKLKNGGVARVYQG